MMKQTSKEQDEMKKMYVQLTNGKCFTNSWLMQD